MAKGGRGGGIKVRTRGGGRPSPMLAGAGRVPGRALNEPAPPIVAARARGLTEGGPFPVDVG